MQALVISDEAVASFCENVSAFGRLYCGSEISARCGNGIFIRDNERPVTILGINVRKNESRRFAFVYRPVFGINERAVIIGEIIYSFYADNLFFGYLIGYFIDCAEINDAHVGVVRPVGNVIDHLARIQVFNYNIGIDLPVDNRIDYGLLGNIPLNLAVGIGGVFGCVPERKFDTRIRQIFRVEPVAYSKTQIFGFLVSIRSGRFGNLEIHQLFDYRILMYVFDVGIVLEQTVPYLHAAGLTFGRNACGDEGFAGAGADRTLGNAYSVVLYAVAGLIIRRKGIGELLRKFVYVFKPVNLCDFLHFEPCYHVVSVLTEDVPRAVARSIGRVRFCFDENFHFGIERERGVGKICVSLVIKCR